MEDNRGFLTLLLLGLTVVIPYVSVAQLTYSVLTLIPENSEIAVGIRKSMKKGEGPFQVRVKKVKIEIDNELPGKNFAAICDKDADLKDERFFLESGIDKEGGRQVSRFIVLNGSFSASNCNSLESLPVVRIHETQKKRLFEGKKSNSESTLAVIYYAPSLELTKH